jgi:hypothetical protein
MNADTFGLILNFTGALVLAFSANMQGDVTTNIVASISGAYGTWGAMKIPDPVIKELQRKKSISKMLNLIGYLLFTFGFGIQICAQLHFLGL